MYLQDAGFNIFQRVNILTYININKYIDYVDFMKSNN